MHMTQGHATRNRRTPDTDGMQRAGQVPPHKERALWNFLTWSFFLAQILAADQLLNGQAKAASDLDLPASDTGAEVAASLSDGAMPADGMGNTGSEEAVTTYSSGVADDSIAASMKSVQADGPAIAFEAAEVTQSEGTDQGDAVSGSGTLAAGEQAFVDIVMPSIANDIHVGLLDVVIDTVDPLLETVENVIDSLGDTLDTVTDPLLHALSDVVPDLVADIGDSLGDVVEGTVDSLRETLDAVADPLLSVLGDAVPDLVTDLSDSLNDILGGTVDPLLNTTETIVGSLDETLGAITDPLLGTVSDTVPNLVANLGGGLDAVVESAVGPLLNTAESAVNSLDDAVSATVNPVGNTLGNLVSSVSDDAEGADQALNAALEAPTNLLDALASSIGTILETAEAGTDGLGGALASPGELVFPALNIVGIDDLYSGGRYTDYNLALRAEIPSVEMGNAATSSSNPVADVLAALSDAGDADDNDADGLHVPHIAIPGILDGIGLRGLGDGIV